MAEWGISELFSRLSHEDNSNQEALYDQQLGQLLAQSLNESDDPYALISSYAPESLSLNLETQEELSLPPELLSQLLTNNYLLLESSDSTSYFYPIKDKRLVLTITQPLPVVQNNYILKLIFTLLFYFGIIAALLIWAKPLIDRLINLRNTTRKFGEGDLHQRIRQGSNLYISEIENEFNRMADRIETLVADNKLLSNAVSHDLKTPLARLRFGIDVLEETESPEQRNKYLKKISRDLQEMEGLVETLLCYARLDQAKLEMQTSKVDLVAYIDELVATLQTDRVSIHWKPSVNEHFVQGDRRYLSLMINNLVVNAAQHAKKNIAILLETTDNTSKLIIEDDGPGIPINQRQAVLKPFVRGQEDRGTPGHGMGLAIVNRIIGWHRWGLKIGDSPTLGGAQVEVTIT